MTTNTHTKTMLDPDKPGQTAKYDVWKLLEVVSDKPTQVIELSQIHGVDRSKRTGFSKKRFQVVDPNLPLLVTQNYFLIDGRHRYFKLLDLGETTAKVIVVTPQDLRLAKYEEGEKLISR
jgi:hypothetical protein